MTITTPVEDLRSVMETCCPEETKIEVDGRKVVCSAIKGGRASGKKVLTRAVRKTGENVSAISIRFSDQSWELTVVLTAPNPPVTGPGEH